MKRKLAIAALVGLIAIGGLVAQVVTTNIDRATLSARVTFLERYIRAPDTVSEDEARAMLTRLNRVTIPGAVVTDTVRQLAARLAELEAHVPGGVVSTQEAADRMGQQTHVYGTVERVHTANDRHGRPFIILTLRGGFSIAWFGADANHALYRVEVGQGLVVSGTVGEYQGNPQIVIRNPADVTLP